MEYTPETLVLERRGPDAPKPQTGPIMITPPLDEDYWTYRVKVSSLQAVVGFPKFGTIGVGFAVESDWNTNLPYTCTTGEIFEHIKHNAGDPEITDLTVLRAIEMIQEAARADRAAIAGPAKPEPPEHLRPSVSDRGFGRLPDLPGTYGGYVRAFESSAAEGPHIWLKVSEPEATSGKDKPVDAAIHLPLHTVAKLRDQLDYLLTEHYQVRD